MKGKVYAENWDGERRFLGTMIYDNVSRVIQLYDDERLDDEEIVVVDDEE